MSIPFILQRQLADLRVQRRQIHRRRPGATVKELRSALEQLAFPFGDLVRMQLELFAPLGHGAIFSQRCQRHTRLERRVVGAPSAPPRCLLLHHHKLLLAGPISVPLYTRSSHL